MVKWKKKALQNTVLADRSEQCGLHMQVEAGTTQLVDFDSNPIP